MAPSKNCLARRIRFRLSWSLILLAALSSQALSCDWSGDWTIKWGTWEGSTHTNLMTLAQSGDEVSGSYDWMGGRIEGNIVGDKLMGQWTQKNGEWGRFEFTMASNCSSFEGTWGYKDNIENGYWNGNR
jgi:hypothetical protein